ncbi:STAS domain-containing protein [Paenibacillus sp. MBLB4367]|uniref:STAS domain-containing protein n=1 Tax=Paenibacillus sp. MBLB4367 TaxID=3384767 RepID=UPI00390826D8
MSAMHKFRLHKQSTENENVVHLSGELDLSAATYLTTELDPLVKERDRTLILNLSEVTYIDSTGIGIFVSILKARTAMNASFRLAYTPAPIQRLLDLTGVSRFFAGNPH